MKLDYLQFLELEVFTRFGTRLEAGMEAAIRRGQLLREILKQERLAPLPAVFQLAWLIAFNEGLLDAAGTEHAGDVMAALLPQVRDSGLTLDSPREDWLNALSGWLADPAGARTRSGCPGSGET